MNAPDFLELMRKHNLRYQDQVPGLSYQEGMKYLQGAVADFNKQVINTCVEQHQMIQEAADAYARAIGMFNKGD